MKLLIVVLIVCSCGVLVAKMQPAKEIPAITPEIDRSFWDNADTMKYQHAAERSIKSENE